MLKLLGAGVTRSFTNHEVAINGDLDDYAAFVKFIEQAFEWELMSYTFYPFYWGNRASWNQMYQYDNNDPLFRNFMQAGMARVIATVRPGFEEAVRYYMQTGQIWSGGEVPVIEDKLFLSIVDELREPMGKKEGKAWATRLPTSLTILQAQSIGLNVVKALPFDENLSDFQDPATVPQSAGLYYSEEQMGGALAPKTGNLYGEINGNQNLVTEIMLRNLDNSPKDFTSCTPEGNWILENIPVGKYQLNLDENNQFEADGFEIVEGSSIVVVEVLDNQSIAINLTVKKR